MFRSFFDFHADIGKTAHPTMPDPNSRIGHLRPDDVAVIGIPFDGNASFLRGAALAPARIRKALHCGSANYCAESGFDLDAHEGWCDLGDLELSRQCASAFATIEQKCQLLLNRTLRILSLGGDHSITYPIIRAHARRYPGLNILHLDAHPDLYDECDGNRYSHACQFARIMEDELAARLVQVGIRTMTPDQRRQAARFGVEVIEMRDWRPGLSLAFTGPVYLSLDLDVFDPAFAPGVSHREPGGPSTREVLQLIQNLQGTLVGADIVEFNPRRDPQDITAMLAAKLLKEIVARLLG